MSKKPKKSEPIIKNENYGFTRKFSERELESKKEELSGKLMEKYEQEQAIIQAKEKIKAIDRNLNRLGDLIREGGEKVWEECEVKIYRDTMKKEYYFDDELVGTEEAEEEDFQLEIE